MDALLAHNVACNVNGSFWYTQAVGCNTEITDVVWNQRPLLTAVVLLLLKTDPEKISVQNKDTGILTCDQISAADD
jgi:hypothetical protein